jgi:hypothetical protein
MRVSREPVYSEIGGKAIKKRVEKTQTKQEMTFLERWTFNINEMLLDITESAMSYNVKGKWLQFGFVVSFGLMALFFWAIGWTLWIRVCLIFGGLQLLGMSITWGLKLYRVIKAKIKKRWTK